MNVWVGQFQGQHIGVIGDAIIDRYHFGEVKRLSPEAPVPVFVETRQENRQGGAANVSRQIEALNARASEFFGVVTSIKHRYMVGSHYLFRIDEDKQHNWPHEYQWQQFVSNKACIVLSDYAKGLLTPQICEAIIAEAASQGVPVVVDPKGTDWLKYRGATAICPNHHELAAFGKTAASVMFPLIFEKCGADGIRVHDGEIIKSYPALNNSPVDVTGAGDTVTAVVALGIATSMPVRLIAQLANEAAAIVVGKVGTSVATAAELQ